jgi:potassium-transporting ATPase KdpC subunit
MLKTILSGLRLFIIMTIITGVLYPLFITLAGQAIFPAQANGSLIEKGGAVIGSSLIGQNTDDPRYFASRPSAVNYMLGSSPESLGSSGASNLSVINTALVDTVKTRETAFRELNGLADDVAVPLEMLFASGSGLDPHISPQAARLQIDRIATARALDRQVVADLVERHIETPVLGVLGMARVNVLLLNVALDELE